MTTSINWPPSLPQNVLLAGYSEKSGVLVSVTPMDAGTPKMRRRGNKPDILSVSFLMTAAQVVTVSDFVKSTIMGVKRFNFSHPRTQASVEVRLVSSNGEYFTTSAVSATHYLVALSIEVLP